MPLNIWALIGLYHCMRKFQVIPNIAIRPPVVYVIDWTNIYSINIIYHTRPCCCRLNLIMLPCAQSKSIILVKRCPTFIWRIVWAYKLQIMHKNKIPHKDKIGNNITYLPLWRSDACLNHIIEAQIFKFRQPAMQFWNSNECNGLPSHGQWNIAISVALFIAEIAWYLLRMSAKCHNAEKYRLILIVTPRS